MKIFLLLFWLMPIAALANPLTHTKWLDEAASKCPTSIFFGVRKFIFINKCYTERSDGVFERGIYAVVGKELRLFNRQVSATGPFEFIPQDVNRIRIESLTPDRLLLNVDGKTKAFRRLLPSSMKKARKQPIRHYPFIFNAGKTSVTYF